MADNYSFRDYLQSGSNRNNTTNVNVVGMSRDALSGIMDALDEQAHLINSLIRGISDSEAEAARRAREEAAARRRAEEEARNQFKTEQSGEKSSQVRSIANERRQRAANAAVNGKINKGLSAIDVLTNTLKDIGEKLIGIVSDMAKQSLRAYDDNTKNMRKQFLTTAQIKENLLKGDKAKEALSKMGIEVNSNETKSIISELANAGADTKSLTDKQIAAITMMNKTMGTDVKTALTLVKTSKDPEEIIKMAVQASDTTGRETTAKLMQSVNESWFARYAQQVGGTEKAISEFQKLAKSLDASLGDYGLSADSQKGLIETAVKISSGQIEKVKQDEIANMLAISGDAMKNPEKLVEGIQNMITRTDISKEDKLARLRVLDGVEGINKELITSLNNAITANSVGEYKQKQIRDNNENLDAINQAQQGGKLGGLVDSIMTSLNTATGGMFSGLSASMNEYFGDNLSMEVVVSNGFKTITTILLGIAASKLLSGPDGLLKSIVSALGLSKIMSVIFNKKDSNTPGNTSTNHDPKPSVDNATLDKQYREVIEKFKSLPETIKYTAKNAFSSIKAKFEEADIKRTFNNVGANIKKAFTNVGANIKKVFSNIGTNIKNIFNNVGANIKQTWKRAVVSIANSSKGFKSTAGKVGKGLAIGGGAAIGIASLFADTGAFDSLIPILDSFVKSLAPPIKVVADTLAPTIEKFLQTASPILGQIIETLAPILDAILKSLAPVLTVLLQAFAPILDVILKSLTPILKILGDVLVKLQPVIEVVAKVIGVLIKPLELLSKVLEVKYEKELREKDQENMKKAREKEATINEIGERRGKELTVYDDDKLKKIAEGVAQATGNTAMLNAISTANREGLINMIRLNSREKISDEDFAKIVFSQTGIQHKELKEYANGGVINKATPAIVGEAGKEAVLPLTKPNALSKVLQSLTPSEKFKLLRSLLSQSSFTFNSLLSVLAGILKSKSSSFLSKSDNNVNKSNDFKVQNIVNSVPGDDQATLNRILGFAGPYAGIVYQRLLHGWKGNVKDGFKQRKKWYDEAIANAANQEGRELIRGTYAERALDYGVSELGKPYILRSLGKIGYVCNELVNACIQASGFNMGKFRVHGVKATFANIQKGKYSGKEYPNFRIRNDLTPQTAIPGMVFFQDSRKNQEGGFQPGHIGLVYYGHQKLHASGGSSNYTKEGFLPNWQTPCRGVTVTPFDGSNYVIGEFPGLFEQVSGNFKSNSSSSIPFGPTSNASSGSEIKNYSSSFSSSVNSAVKKAGLLSDDELNELAKEAGLQNASAMTEFIKQAEILLNSNKDRDSIVAILLDIAKYLRGAVTSSKQQMVSVARPAASIYG